MLASKVAQQIPNQWPEDLREGHDEAEDHGIQVCTVIHFYIGDDDDGGDDDELDIEDCEMIEVENPRLKDLQKREMMWPSFLTVELM